MFTHQTLILLSIQSSHLVRLQDVDQQHGGMKAGESTLVMLVHLPLSQPGLEHQHCIDERCRVFAGGKDCNRLVARIREGREGK